MTRVKRIKVPLEASWEGGAASPVIEFVGGERPYLWVGDEDGVCLGTVEITPKTYRLAQAILDSNLVKS